MKLQVNLNTVINGVVLAGILWLASFLRHVDRRLLRIEVKLGIDQEIAER